MNGVRLEYGAGGLSYCPRRLALDRTMVQSSYLDVCRVMWGPLNECSFASVCLSVCL